MKITTFNPQIITKDPESIVQLFQALGFEKHHNPKGIGELNVEGIRMKDANGFYLWMILTRRIRCFRNTDSRISMEIRRWR